MLHGQLGRRAVFAHVEHAASWISHAARAFSVAVRNALWRHGAILLWALLVLGAIACLTRYSYAPGPSGLAPNLASANMPFCTDGTRYLLVTAIHPKCPCSRASLGELERLLALHRSSLICTALVYRPRPVEPAWARTAIVETLDQLPNTDVVADVDGIYATRLGMLTSGAVVLYSPQGDVEFAGGITASRGHAGDNPGAAAISRILGGARSIRRTPVYGCPIHGALTAGNAM